MTNRLIIHHESCPDGFGSAWLALRTFFPDADLHPATYDDAPPPWDLVEGADVLIVDFCYPTAELDEIARRAQTLTVLDHHQTAKAFLEDSTLTGYPDPTHLFEALDEPGYKYVHMEDHSGIGLVSWFAFELGHHTPEWVHNIEDRDLWRFRLPDTKDVVAAIAARPYTLEAWDEFAGTDIQALKEEGRGINRYRDMLIESVSSSTFDISLGGYRIPCVSSPYAIGSDVAGILAKTSPSQIGAYCILHDDNVQLGLRSTPDGPDVAELAEKYDGGGHAHASGIRLAWDEFWRASQ